MKKEKLNFAIIGLGNIGKEHAIGAYAANFKLNLPFTLNLKTVVSRKQLDYDLYGVENVFDSEIVMHDKEIHFVDICTTNEAHREFVEKAAMFKKPVYCEKPLAASYEEAVKMAKAVEESKVINAVAFVYRFMPAVRLLKEEIKKGTIGEIIDYKATLYHKSYLDPKKKRSWRTLESSGGGALLDLGVHLIDLIEFTLGKIEKVRCTTSIFFAERTMVDEIASCSLMLENGIKGSIEVSRIFADSIEPTSLTIYGTKGSLKFNTLTPYILQVYNYETDCTEQKSSKGIKDILQYYPDERGSLGSHQDGHIASIANFARLVYNGNQEEDELTPTFKDALKVQKVIKACYDSASQNKDVIV